MTQANKTARRIFREWCKANDLAVDPLTAADLVARIEAVLVSPADRGTGT